MAILLQYTGAAGWGATTVDADVSGGAITNASLDSATNNYTATFASDPVYRSYPAASSTNIAEAVANNSYWSFTLTPDVGKQIDLTSLTMNVSRGGASTPRGYGLRSSIDSYAANIATADINQEVATWMAVDIDLTGAAYQNLISAVTFRIYYYGPSNLVAIYTDDLTINGTVSAGEPPTVTTAAITDIASTTATGGGEITDEGDAAVTAYGVCWNTGGSPTIADSHTTDGP